MNSAGLHVISSSGLQPLFPMRAGALQESVGPSLDYGTNRLGLRATLLVMLVGTACWAKSPQIKHVPQQPKSGDSVQITLELSGKSIAETCLLEYQVVEPGKYIALKDPEFQNV